MEPALALLEFDSIAIGVRAGDAMVKRAPVGFTYAGTVHPGKYLVMVGGDVASVEEAFIVGRSTGGAALIDAIFLPGVHEAVVATLRGERRPAMGEALGMVETRTVVATVAAADAAVKGAEVELMEIHTADRLGGKAYCVISGHVADVEVAVDLAAAAISDPQNLVARVVIPQLHEEMAANLAAAPDFAARIGGASRGEL